jgi:L-alanine-DL-glutamate epimerase-like enolase superfamily enzyme
MRIEQLEIWPVRVPYRHAELSSLVARDGVTDVIVKAIVDDGMVGWGECTRAADPAGIARAVEAMRPIVLRRDRSTWMRSRATCSLPAAGSSRR